MTVVRAVAILALLAVGVGACGGEEDEAEPPRASIRTIEITETDFALSPSSVKLDKAGSYTFRAFNSGEVTHALEIEGAGIEEETDDLAPGESAEITVELKDGQYELYCPVGNHADQGMKGNVTVGAGGGAATNERGGSPY